MMEPELDRQSVTGNAGTRTRTRRASGLNDPVAARNLARWAFLQTLGCLLLDQPWHAPKLNAEWTWRIDLYADGDGVFRLAKARCSTEEFRAGLERAYSSMTGQQEVARAATARVLPLWFMKADPKISSTLVTIHQVNAELQRGTQP